jgi:hypothetical protein
MPEIGRASALVQVYYLISAIKRFLTLSLRGVTGLPFANRLQNRISILINFQVNIPIKVQYKLTSYREGSSEYTLSPFLSFQ